MDKFLIFMFVLFIVGVFEVIKEYVKICMEEMKEKKESIQNNSTDVQNQTK